MRDATLQFYKEQMLRVLLHIQQHLDESLELRELARLASLSPSHFHHVFSGMLGESMAAHIRRLRLERAASRLKLTRSPIIEVALEAGYEAHEAFTRAFRSAFKLSPTEYRRRNTDLLRIQAASGIHFGSNGSLRRFRVTNAAPIKVSVMQLKPKRMAFVRHTGPYERVGQTWGKLILLAGREGLLGGNCEFIGICHDDPAVTPPNRIRYDACITADERFKPRGDVGVQIIAGGDYTMTTHFGPYEKLGQTYAKLLGRWLPRSGRTLRFTPCFEIYLNSPENSEPRELLTDIYAPLQ
jgi:AraC family transcriptional regulator